jgi:flavodoxin
MPNLLNFLESNGTFLTDHHTPLISHTAVDILTSLTGVYGDKMGIPIGNSLRYYNPNGTTNGMSSFAYWTDPLAAFSGQTITDTTPQMIDQQGKTHPAPWVPFTRAGCDVGAFSVANIDFENIGLDITTVFGNGSAEQMEATSNPPKAQADFLGIAVHCAKNSPLCVQTGKPDLLPQEPGGYVGFEALFGNKYVQPQISPGGPVTDIDGVVIQDSHGNPGFPNLFNPSAAQTLGYLATMLEAGVPVVFGYIADAHDNHFTGSGTFGPGESLYVAQLAAYNDALGRFFDRLKKDGITPQNTLFVVTADENDHFAGGPPVPANCDGIHVPCTYAKIGEVNADLSRVLATEFLDTTPFTVHSDDAPAFYITGNPSQTDPTTRQLERHVGSLTAINPITGNTELLTQRIADQTEQKVLHMVTADQNRTPTFIMFANPDYFLLASGNTAACAPLSACFVENPGFAWNHGDFQEQITNTWLAMVGPGVLSQGATGATFTDHTDIRPTILGLAGLTDDYQHDGRVLYELFDQGALPGTVKQARDTLLRLAQAYKDINAPLGTLGRATLQASTMGVEGDNATYAIIKAELNGIEAQRDAIAGQMIALLEAVEFHGQPVDVNQAETLISKAQSLLASLP